jgi:hypothetical protein
MEAMEEMMLADRLLCARSQLGHSSVAMTFDRYGHLFPNLEDDHEKFAAGTLSIVGRLVPYFQSSS